MLKETTGNTEMENRLLYSPKEVREKRMRILNARAQVDQPIAITVTHRLLDK